MTFWDFFWLLVWSWFFVMYLTLLFHIVKDLFGDPDVGGVEKALWLIGLILVPFIVALVYVIMRGQRMAERQASEVRRARAASDQYIQSVARTSGPAEQIASAKSMLDDGTITADEFERLKAKALA